MICAERCNGLSKLIIDHFAGYGMMIKETAVSSDRYSTAPVIADRSIMKSILPGTEENHS